MMALLRGGENRFHLEEIGYWGMSQKDTFSQTSLLPDCRVMSCNALPRAFHHEAEAHRCLETAELSGHLT